MKEIVDVFDLDLFWDKKKYIWIIYLKYEYKNFLLRENKFIMVILA